MINFIYMVETIIADLFRKRVGKFQGKIGADGKPSEKKALLINFKLERDRIQMLIHAPCNYVAIYTRRGKGYRKKKGKWNCLVYHDSCWTSDGLNRFLWEFREHLSFCLFPLTEGWDIVETLTDAIHVVKLDEVQLDEFKQIRNKKYS